MGQELECTMRYRNRRLAGKAYLETDHLLFRGDERLKIALKDLTRVAAAGGVLNLEFAGGPAELELGKAQQVGGMVGTFRRTLPGQLVVLAQEGWQPQRLEVVRQQELGRVAHAAALPSRAM